MVKKMIYKDIDEISDDEILVLGSLEPNKPDRPNRGNGKRLLWIAVAAVVAVVVVALVVSSHRDAEAEALLVEPSVFEPVEAPVVAEAPKERIGRDTTGLSYVEIVDTTINDVDLRVLIPHNSSMTLEVGAVRTDDEDVVLVAQAADVRADNGGIVGAFVLKGEPRSWDRSKSGYCAVIDGEITVGVASDSPLFEKATETGGYFFRQYPLVSDGVLVENEPKGKSFRRAICDRNGEIFVVASLSSESYHDFAQSLVDLGVDQAVSLVGGAAYYRIVGADGQVTEYGRVPASRYKKASYVKNASYVVWRKM